jgi:hypothetical protein
MAKKENQKFELPAYEELARISFSCKISGFITVRSNEKTEKGIFRQLCYFLLKIF